MGFQGKVNVYTCEKCGGRTVTVDRDEGVTPFMLGCRASGEAMVCAGFGYSSFYRPDSDCGEPSWEWYKPSEKEIRRMGDAEREHVRLGGLSLRKIKRDRKVDDSVVPVGYYRDSHGSIRKAN